MACFQQNILLATLGLLLLGLTGCDSSSKKEREENVRPNIIFIMSDDHARRTVSAYEGSINETPNIDRLAAEGALFTNSFVANSICAPSRAAILTGKHSHKNGVVGNASPWNNKQMLFPRILQQAGYTTALIGKWHLNSPPGDEFDYADRLTGAGKQGFYYNPDFERKGGQSKKIPGYSTDLVTDKALDWLSSNTDEKANPFLLFVQFKAPHVPRMPEFRFLDRYKNDSIPEPTTLFDDFKTRAPYAAQAKMGIHYRPLPPMDEHNYQDNIYSARMMKEQREKWHRYKDPEAREYHQLKDAGRLEGNEEQRFAYQKFIKDYLRIIDGVDANVGRLLKWLDEHPEIKKNTVIVYTSDQGYFTGEHGWAEKRFMYEESIRMPLLMRWPGAIEKGTRIEAMVQNVDFAPTFLDLAGIDIPDEIQGRSIKSLLQGKVPEGWRENMYYHYYDHGIHNVPRHEGVRNDRYKLIHFYTDDNWELYDLENDPHEINNLYSNAEYENIVRKLKSELQVLRDQYEVPADHFKPPYVRAGKNQKL